MVRRSIKLACVIASLTTAASAIGIGYGLNGVAIGVSIAMLGWTVPHLAWATRGTGIDWREMLAIAVRPLVGSVAGVVTAFAVLRVAGPHLPPLLRLISGGGILIVVYVVALAFVMGEKTFYLDLILTIKPRAVSGQETESQP
jgi:hypothetical protein